MQVAIRYLKVGNPEGANDQNYLRIYINERLQAMSFYQDSPKAPPAQYLCLRQICFDLDTQGCCCLFQGSRGVSVDEYPWMLWHSNLGSLENTDVEYKVDTEEY